MQNYVITIARGFGSGGKEIATMLSERLGIPCYDREIITMASKYSGIDESVFVEVDEKLRGGYIRNFWKRVPSVPYIVEAHEKDFVSDINLFNIQTEVIRNLAKTESCIIVGKCADFVLRDRSNVVSVYIEAPRNACLGSIMGKMHVTKERAETLIKKTDKYRANYYKFYTKGKDWTNPINYDMTLNSDRVGRKKCVDLICEYVKIKMAP